MIFIEYIWLKVALRKYGTMTMSSYNHVKIGLNCKKSLTCKAELFIAILQDVFLFLYKQRNKKFCRCKFHYILNS